MSPRSRLFLIGGGIGVVLGGLAVLGVFRAKQVAESMEISTSSGLPLIGGSFELIDKDKKTWTDKDFKGKPLLVYFGYTYCPDICPTALYSMSQAIKELGGARVVQPLFITLDPDRDTPAQLQNYMQPFLKDFILLTGPKPAIDKVVHAYRVHAARVKGEEGKEASEEYLVDHSSLIYLMSKEGKYIAHFNHQTPPSEIIARITQHLKTGE